VVLAVADDVTLLAGTDARIEISKDVKGLEAS
jgi:hypothetical protein